MAKRPAILFYTGDWIKDTALRCCSVGARGMWIDMICYMHDCKPYGHLKVGDKVILPVNLAALIGITLVEVEGYLKELFDAGVCAKKPDGTIYSERMVRDEEIRSKRAEGGVKGGNPQLKKPIRPKKKKKEEGYPSLEDVDVNANEDVNAITMPYESEDFSSAWDTWKAYKKKQHSFTYKSEHSEQAALMELAKLSDGVELTALAIIHQSIAKGWSGLFKIKEDKNGSGTNNGKQPTGANVNSKSAFAKIDAMYGTNGAGGQ